MHACAVGNSTGMQSTEHAPSLCSHLRAFAVHGCRLLRAPDIALNSLCNLTSFQCHRDVEDVFLKYILLLLQWRYIPGWALASFTIRLQASRSLALSLHSFIPIFLRSVDTSSSHLIFGIPLRLVAYSFPYNIFFEEIYTVQCKNCRQLQADKSWNLIFIAAV